MNGDVRLNLLPLEYRRRRLMRRRLKGWAAVWAAAALVGCGLFWLAYRDYQAEQDRLASRRVEYAPLERMRNELGVMRTQIAELAQREALALQLADEQPALAMLGLVSRAARQCEGAMFVEQLTLARGRRVAGAEARRVLSLEGLAANHDVILQFAEHLREAEVFDRVDPKQSQAATAPSGAPAVKYLIECVF